MTYGTNEAGVQTAQPVELYQFTLTDANAPTGDPVTSDTLQYADQAAMEAGGWTVLDADAEWSWAWNTGHAIAGSGLSSSMKGYRAAGFGGATRENITLTRTFSVGAGAVVRAQMWAEGVGSQWAGVTVKIRNTAGTQASNDTDGNDGVEHLLTGPVAASGDGLIHVTIFMAAANITYTTDNNFYFSGFELLGAEEGASPPATEYNYTSNHSTVTFAGTSYLPAIFTRSAFTSGEEDAAPQDVDITMPRDHAIAQLFHSGLPVAPVVCTIYRIHRSDIAGGTSYATAFKGQVSRARFQGASCVLTVESGLALLNRKLPRILVQKPCQNMLYDSVCGLNRESFRFDSTVDAVDLTGGVMTLTITGLEADGGVYSNGFLVLGSGEKVFIERQDGDDVVLLSPLLDVSVSDDVAVYEGCDRSVSRCNDLGNLVHYLGMPLVPQKNPYAGTGLS